MGSPEAAISDALDDTGSANATSARKKLAIAQTRPGILRSAAPSFVDWSFLFLLLLPRESSRSASTASDHRQPQGIRLGRILEADYWCRDKQRGPFCKGRSGNWNHRGWTRISSGGGADGFKWP